MSRLTDVARFFALGALALGATAVRAETDRSLEHARQVLREAPIIDGHNDLPWALRGAAEGKVENAVVANPSSADTDMERLRRGGIGAQFWSVYVPSSIAPPEAVHFQLEQIDLARRMIDANPEHLELALSVGDIERAAANGRIASLLGIEGAHTIANSLAVLRSYYDLGVRYIGLTHLHSNDWADSATGDATNDGLSEFGRDVILEMNRLGMIVDVAHTSEATISDVLEVSEAPVIVSHTAARALTDHPRNLSDDTLRAIAASGGVVMVYFIPPFVSEEAREWMDGMMPLLMEAKSNADWQRINDEYIAEHGLPGRATIQQVADHIEHIARIAGPDHVGIGADFYGASKDHELVAGLEDVSKYPELFAALIRRGWDDSSLARLSRENVLRVMRDVEANAE